MRNRIALVGVLGFIVVLLLWNFAFFGPAGKDANKAKHDRSNAEQQAAQLESQLHSLQQISNNAPELKAQIDKLNAAVPPTPDLEGFIRSAVDLEQQAGVDWVSVEPSPPAAGGTATQIKMQIVVAGGFFQVLDYLNRLEALTRIVVVDGINVASGATSSPSSSSGSGSTPTTVATSSGAPSLTVTLNARMFTQAPPATGATSGPGGSTTPTTAAPTPTTSGAQ